MSATTAVEIPDRPLFKAAEVCELLKLQPYVLKSWEAEFPELGISKSAGAARVYRRGDIEQVQRIKHLLLVEGLTLAGARRKLEAETAPVAGDEPVIDDLFGEHARARLTEIRRGLRSILDLLSGSGAGTEFHLAPPRESGSGRRPAMKSEQGVKAKSPGASAPATKRKRSA